MNFSADLLGENGQTIGTIIIFNNRTIYDFKGEIINTPSIWELYDKQGSLGRIYWDGKVNFTYKIGPNLSALIEPIIQQYLVKIPAKEMGIALDQLFDFSIQHLSKGVIWGKQITEKLLQQEKSWEQATKRAEKDLDTMVDLVSSIIAKNQSYRDISNSLSENITKDNKKQIRFSCEFCKKWIIAKRNQQCLKIKCPFCKEKIVIPEWKHCDKCNAEYLTTEIFCMQCKPNNVLLPQKEKGDILCTNCKRRIPGGRENDMLCKNCAISTKPQETSIEAISHQILGFIILGFSTFMFFLTKSILVMFAITFIGITLQISISNLNKK